MYSTNNYFMAHRVEILKLNVTKSEFLVLGEN